MEHLTIGQLGAWATIILSLITLGTVMIKPFLNINKSLTKTTSILNDIQKEIKNSIDDRKVLHEKVEYNDKRLDKHEVVLMEHKVKIENLEGNKND